MRVQQAASVRTQPRADRLRHARGLLGDAPACTSQAVTRSDLGPRGSGVHEWFTEDRLPPIALMIDAAWQSLHAHPHHRICWVGRVCWPYPHALLRRGGSDTDCRLLDASMFVDARNTAERVWAIEVASRCDGVGVVVADGRGISMAESRRLQLAAAAAQTCVQLVRPDHERAELSAARTRWRVASQLTTDRRQAWTVELLRHKGGTDAWFGSGRARRWLVQRDHATGTISEWQTSDVGVASEVVGRPFPALRTQIA